MAKARGDLLRTEGRIDIQHFGLNRFRTASSPRTCSALIPLRHVTLVIPAEAGAQMLNGSDNAAKPATMGSRLRGNDGHMFEDPKQHAGVAGHVSAMRG